MHAKMVTYGRYFYWPPVRARNFVKELGFTPTVYKENMAILASMIGMPLHKMDRHCNPVSFGSTFLFRDGDSIYNRRLYDEDFVRLLGPSTYWYYSQLCELGYGTEWCS